jgi:hypothetical protein
MGVIIKCDDKILHSTYTDFNLMKQHFLNGYFKGIAAHKKGCIKKIQLMSSVINMPIIEKHVCVV